MSSVLNSLDVIKLFVNGTTGRANIPSLPHPHVKSNPPRSPPPEALPLTLEHKSSTEQPQDNNVCQSARLGAFAQGEHLDVGLSTVASLCKRHAAAVRGIMPPLFDWGGEGRLLKASNMASSRTMMFKRQGMKGEEGISASKGGDGEMPGRCLSLYSAAAR